jgi:hypothetical protein
MTLAGAGRALHFTRYFVRVEFRVGGQPLSSLLGANFGSRRRLRMIVGAYTQPMVGRFTPLRTAFAATGQESTVQPGSRFASFFVVQVQSNQTIMPVQESPSWPARVVHRPETYS